MAYSKKEFAALTGQTTKTLSTYILRKKVVVGANGLIDMTNETNIAFLKKYGAGNEPEPTKKAEIPPDTSKKKRIALSKAIPGAGDDKEEDSENDDEFLKELLDGEQIPPLWVSEKAFKHWQALKTKREAAIKQIELDKKEGLLIPTELVNTLILQQAKSYSASFRQEAEKIIELFMIKYKMSATDAAAMRKTLVEKINKGITEATDETKKAVKSIVEEFTEKREVGERGRAA